MIFDRSWYNRAGVERVWGFATEKGGQFLQSCRWSRSDGRSGIILIKYWLEVSPEEQTRRLEARIDDGRKIWKLSPMDLMSYSRWYDYSRARDECSRRPTRTGRPGTWCGPTTRGAPAEHHHPPALADPVQEAAAGEGQAPEAPEAGRLSRAELSVQAHQGRVLRRCSTSARGAPARAPLCRDDRLLDFAIANPRTSTRAASRRRTAR